MNFIKNNFNFIFLIKILIIRIYQFIKLLFLYKLIFKPRQLTSIMLSPLKIWIKEVIHNKDIPSYALATYVILKCDKEYYYIRPFTDDVYHSLPVFEHRLRKILNKVLSKGDVMIDVGANIGSHTINAAKLVRENGCVIAIEPIPANIAELNINLRLNDLDNVVIFPYAAYSFDKIMKIYFNPIYTGHSSKNISSPDCVGINVYAKRIDDMIKEFERKYRKLNAIKLMKIDVEGSEYEVLKGSIDTLKRTKLIIVEAVHNKKQLMSFLKQHIFFCKEIIIDDRSHLFCVNLRSLSYKNFLAL